MKRKNKFLIMMFTLVIVTSCNRSKNSFFIKEELPISLFRESGEIRISFKKNSIFVESIEFYNTKNELILSQKIDEQGLISAKLRVERNDSIFNMDYKLFFSEIQKEQINDSIYQEISHRLIATRELKHNNGDLFYLDMHENGKKRYNALNMKLIDSEWVDKDKVNLLLKNYFPFNGEFEFYYGNSNEKLFSKKIEDNYYLVEYRKELGKEENINIDVEIIPSDKDSLIHSVFTQEIFVKYRMNIYFNYRQSFMFK